MRSRLTASFLLSLGILMVAAGSTMAQTIRPFRTFYILPSVGAAYYLGDRSNNNVSNESQIGWIGGVEIGYQYTSRLGVAGAYRVGHYPQASDAFPDREGEYPRRHHGQLYFRYTARASERQFTHTWLAGMHGTVGLTAPEPSQRNQLKDKLAIGPLIGLGLNYMMSDRTALWAGLQGMINVPDDAFDGLGHAGKGPFDTVLTLQVGIRFNLRSATELQQRSF